MTIRSNGSYIGPRPTGPSSSVASGIWDLRTVERQMRASAWPMPAAVDPDFASVSLLLHCDGSNGSTSFTDSSANAFSVTANGDAQISTTQSKWSGSSCYLDGSGDYLSVANDADFDFGSGDMTVEAWIYIAGNSAADIDGSKNANIVNTWNTTGATISGYALSIQGNASSTGTGLAFDTWSSSNATLYRATATVTQSAWHHIAVSISGGTRRLYLDGTEVSGTTTTIGSGYTEANSLGNALRVGVTPNSGYPLPFYGYIDDLRITKGVARYTLNFTPPTAAFPDTYDQSSFTPTDISGLSLWLDASSADTLFDATSGGSLVAADGGVARWEDKSGNASHAVQATGASQPLRKTSVQNGKDVLRFDGSNDTLQISSITLPTYLTVFVVSSTTRAGTDLKFWMEHSANVNSNDGFFFNGTYEGAWTIRRGAGSSAVRYGPVVNSSDWIGSGWALASLTYNADGVGAIYKNGIFVSDDTLDLSTTLPATSALSNSDVTAALNIASRNGSALFMTGDIGEILIYNSALSSVSRAAIEAYLLSKWAIA